MHKSDQERSIGIVYLVGAGPGAADLITVRGLRYLRQADVVLYDRLVAIELLEEAPAHAQRIHVGKVPGQPHMAQDEINRLMIHLACQGLTVVRLKGGDPFVFGRGGEEALALRAAGVPCQVVPGVSSAFAVPAAVGIPLTHQHLARSFAVISGHARPPLSERLAGGPQATSCATLPEYDWDALAAMDTVVCLMGVKTLPALAQRLLAAGRAPQTPVAIIEWGTMPAQRVIIGPLAEIAEIADKARVRPPATIVLGNVVALHQALQ